VLRQKPRPSSNSPLTRGGEGGAGRGHARAEHARQTGGAQRAVAQLPGGRPSAPRAAGAAGAPSLPLPLPLSLSPCVSLRDSDALNCTKRERKCRQSGERGHPVARRVLRGQVLGDLKRQMHELSVKKKEQKVEAAATPPPPPPAAEPTPSPPPPPPLPPPYSEPPAPSMPMYGGAPLFSGMPLPPSGFTSEPPHFIHAPPPPPPMPMPMPPPMPQHTYAPPATTMGALLACG
jgi:hypothetical protein